MIRNDRRSGAVLVALTLTVVVFSACGGRGPTLEELTDENDCRRTVLVGEPAAEVRALEGDSARRAAASELTLSWKLPAGGRDVAHLNAWCAAVGPAVVGSWADVVTEPPVADTVWLVSWNVHVGGGDTRRLVADLRAGRLTGGRAVEHFVLLLQEAYRESDALPDYEPGVASGSPIITVPPEGPREDIVALAEGLGLWLAYAPSMRNGATEDRGNAILSTLPLEAPVGVALPVARQRRVALAADVAGRTRAGRDWRLQVATVHLESSPSGWTSDQRQRLAQADALVELLPDAEAAVAAGDFNTRIRGRSESLVRVMLRAYPQTPSFPAGPTYHKVGGLYRLYLDYVFVRLPRGADAEYHRVPEPYGSDHFPLVGWVAW